MNVTTKTLFTLAPEHIDVSGEARRMRFRHNVAISRAVWDDCVHWDDLIEAGKSGVTAEEVEARLRDLLWVALGAIRSVKGGRLVHFDLRRVPTTGKGTQTRAVTLSAMIGPDDSGEPLILIGTPILSAR